MMRKVAGVSGERLKEVSKFVGYDIEQFAPGKIRSDIEIKIPSYVITIATLVWPFTHGLIGIDQVTFTFIGTIALFVNLILGFVMIFVIAMIHNDWEQAVTGMGSASGSEACRNVHQAITTLRRLISWDNALGYETFPFSVIYLAVTAIIVAEINGQIGPSPIFGDLAVVALVYFAAVNFIRSVIIFIIMSFFTFPDKLDPSLQICAALAQVHQQFQNCAIKNT